MRKKLFWSLLASCLFFGTAMAQNPTVTGRVTDEKGDPIAGASIQVKGTRTGATANADGTFSLKAANGASLVVSATGFESKTVVAAANLTVKLGVSVNSLNEVVVTGTGAAVSKRKLAISVQSINSDKLPATPAASIDQALVGKIAGAQITSSSGNPGAPVSIQLRGVNTIQGGSQPMVLIDGVEMGASALSTIDLNSVERVEVVQGAASATIYGAQGANGVIQIFTKKGKGGKPRIEFSSRVSQDSYINVGGLRQPKNHSFKTDANGNVIATEMTEDDTLNVVQDPDATEDGMGMFEEKEIDEKFESKKQQKYFFSKCGDGKTKEQKKWCKMADEFAKKTNFAKLPEKKKETKEEFKSFLLEGKDCDWIVVPTYCNGERPVYTDSVSVVYVYLINLDKDVMIVFNHTEGLSLPESLLKEFPKENKIFVYGKKRFKQFLDQTNIIDMNMVEYFYRNQPIEDDFETSAHEFFTRTFGNFNNLNSIIPIAKHIEKAQSITNRFLDVYDSFNEDVAFTKYNELILDSLFQIEQNGLFTNYEQFRKKFNEASAGLTAANLIVDKYKAAQKALEPEATDADLDKVDVVGGITKLQSGAATANPKLNHKGADANDEKAKYSAEENALLDEAV
jgi:hypothetical protein